MTAPEPAAVTGRIPLGRGDGEILDFANGVRVVVLRTPVAADTVYLEARSPGGLAMVAPEQAADALAASELVSRSGTGPLDPVQERRFLATRVASVDPVLDEATEGFVGEASTADLEVLLQLVHLTATQPRIDPSALTAYRGEWRVLADDPTRSPDTALERAVADARFPGDARYAVVPSVDSLAALGPDGPLAVFRDRFGDAGDFVYVLAGDLDLAVAGDLAARYLGTLPTAGRVDAVPDVRPDAPAEPAVLTVEAGVEERGAVTFVLDAPIEQTADVRAHALVLQRLVDDLIQVRIREQLGAAYAHTVSVTLRQRPDPGIETRIRVDLDPARADEVVTETLAILERLRTTGPTAEELAGAVGILVEDTNFYSNESLARYFLDQELVTPTEIVEFAFPLGERIAATSPAAVVALAQVALPLERRVEARLVPSP